jgi:hypothetical protein
MCARFTQTSWSHDWKAFYGVDELGDDFACPATTSRRRIALASCVRGNPDWIWLATNLPECVTAETVGAMY